MSVSKRWCQSLEWLDIRDQYPREMVKPAGLKNDVNRMHSTERNNCHWKMVFFFQWSEGSVSEGIRNWFFRIEICCSLAENRHFGETKMNDRSSRSHTIFRVVSSLWPFIRISQKKTWRQRRAEGYHNLSLTEFLLLSSGYWKPRNDERKQGSWYYWQSRSSGTFGKE